MNETMGAQKAGGQSPATQNRLVREENRPSRAFVTPPANIAAGPDGYFIELEMPGVNKDGIEITVDGSELTVIGRRQSDIPEGELLYYESTPADFRRTFELSADVDTSKIEAHMEQGVLKLRLPRREDFKPRKIPVAD
ncbi:MAG: heat shock protein Hsp20 [Pedosphaera sp.]|nr:heat shock protein Hsp20 [Pedosphaera sp.]